MYALHVDTDADFDNWIVTDSDDELSVYHIETLLWKT